jgi:hypothetical protein
MNKEFIPYEQALELKELGFKERCLGAFDSDGDLHIRNVDFQSDINGYCSAPLYQQVFRWFRKNHGLYSSIIFKKSYPDNHVTGLEWYIIICGGDGVLFDTDGTYTYEEAELACLNKLIEIVGTIELPKHPSVISENGNELLFDKEGNLIKELPKQETLYTEEQFMEELIGFQIYLNNKGLITNHDWDFEKEAKKYIKSLKQPK